jgi:vacuolar-type H+-ATPase subunit I/STV1
VLVAVELYKILIKSWCKNKHHDFLFFAKGGKDLTVAWIVQLVITCVVGIIAYFLKDIKKNTEDKISQINTKVDSAHKKMEETKDALNDYKDEVSKEYVRKDDYLQTNGEIMKRLDKIQDILMDMFRRGGQ